MPQAVGSLETIGFPPVLAASDAMVKAARVTLVSYVRAGSARYTINIRGDVSDVNTAMQAGVEAAQKTVGGHLVTWVVIPRPHENVEAVMSIKYNEAVEGFRRNIEGFSVLPIAPAE